MGLPAPDGLIAVARKFEHEYRLGELDDVLDKENAIHRDIDLRLDAVERLGQAFADGNRIDVDLIIKAYLERVGGLAEQVDGIIDAATGGLATRFSSSSSSTVAVGTGTKSFVVPLADRANFAPSAYLGIVSTADARNAMSGFLASFDRSSGLLVVDVATAIGAGTHADWRISAAPPPMVPVVVDAGFYDDGAPDDYAAIPFTIAGAPGSPDGGTF